MDPFDEYLTGDALKKFDKFPLQHIGKAGLRFGDEDENSKKAEEERKQTFAPLTDWLQEHLSELVSEVRVSSQLTKSPCAVLSSTQALSPDQERLMIVQGLQKDPSFLFYRSQKRIFEINPVCILSLISRSLI